MNFNLILLIFGFFISVSYQLNDRPILGVLLQETETQTDQYVATSYVKFVEMAGARAVN